MTPSVPYLVSPEILKATKTNLPIVALETTVITHGLPYPENIQLALDMQAIIRDLGVVPASIGVLNGQVKVGLIDQELESIANLPDPQKVSLWDLGTTVAKGASGGTTVAATTFIANRAGIKVLATGGIGGVHRGAKFDVSADLHALARSPMIVVCSGAKAILDLEATLEYLESLGIPVLGYQTSEFPAFYARESGLPVPMRVDTPDEVVQIARTHWELKLDSALLVTVPPPEETAMPAPDLENAIAQAIEVAEKEGITGQALTPYLLDRIKDGTSGMSLKANLALLKNNAAIAATIARHLTRPSGQTHF